MWLFKKEGVREINLDLFRYMANEHKIDLVTIDKMSYMTRYLTVSNLFGITLVRVYLPHQAAAKGIKVTGWETFDEYPELIFYEGYLNRNQKPFLVKKGNMIHAN